ncbi:MAG: ribbon-helix-helix domain-containing protein [Chloroflexota bacterium]
MTQITIRADEKILRQVAEIARDKDVSVAAVIRQALESYVTKTEKEMRLANPLLGLIGLAGEDAVEMDLSNGKDEEFLRESWPKHVLRYLDE